MRNILALLVVATAACPLPTPATPCASARDCPLGYSCNTLAGYCVAVDGGSVDHAPGDGAGTDLAATDHIAADQTAADRGGFDGTRDATSNDRAACVSFDAGACGSISVFGDDFSDGIQSPIWEDRGSPTFKFIESGGRLNLSADASNQYAHWITWWNGDLTGGSITVEIDWRGIGANGEINLAFVGPTGHLVGLGDRAGIMRGFKDETGEWNIGNLPARWPDHRYWRIREQSGEILFDLSADGCGWTNLGSTQVAWPNLLGQIDLSTEIYSGSVQHADAWFDNLNTDRPIAPWCNASASSNDFNSTGTQSPWLTESWQVPGGCSYVIDGNGQLVISGTFNPGGWCWYSLRQAQQLDPQVSIELISTTTPAGVLAGLKLWTPTASVTFGRIGNRLVVYVNTQQQAVADNDPRSRLRIRRDGSTLAFEIGDANDVWSTLFSPATSMDLSAVEVSIGLWAATTTSDGVAASFAFDNYNL